MAAALYACHATKQRVASFIATIAFGAKRSYALKWLPRQEINRRGAANATNRAAFGGCAAQLADASGGS